MIRKENQRPSVPGIKTVPSADEIRERVRAAARENAGTLDRSRPVRREQLERAAAELLDQLALPVDFLGFAMVALSNEFWMPQFASIAPSRRLLLLPHCLRRRDLCRGAYTSLGLDCAMCGACPIGELKSEAEELGYTVVVAEGTPAVVQLILGGRADAVLGVACLDSLEKAFERVVDLGIPHVALPLLVDGCEDTHGEYGEIRRMLNLSASRTGTRTRSYVPLLRSAERLFEPGILDALLAGELQARSAVTPDPVDDPMRGTEIIALDWLRIGGKRFRPFISLAAYAAMTLGEAALHPEADLVDAFPEVVRRAAVAIEAFHKASLVHDDIEDDDAFRYGMHTLHRRYGVPTAINVGDYLIGLGYRLISSGSEELGPETACDMLAMLSRAHLRLARGQGAELLMRGRDPGRRRPIDLLSTYALKTAPAFEAALAIGLRAAGPINRWTEHLAAYCRYLGVAFQVLNDLRDWNIDADKLVAGQDLLSNRPTVLQAFAFETAGTRTGDDLAAIIDADETEDVKIAGLRDLYRKRGVFGKADALVDRYRRRATAVASGLEPPALRELLHFIVDIVLR